MWGRNLHDGKVKDGDVDDDGGGGVDGGDDHERHMRLSKYRDPEQQQQQQQRRSAWIVYLIRWWLRLVFLYPWKSGQELSDSLILAKGWERYNLL